MTRQIGAVSRLLPAASAACVLAAAALLISRAAHSQGPLQSPEKLRASLASAPPPHAAEQTTPNPEDVLFSEESHEDEKTGIFILHNWKYTRDDMVVTGANAIYNREKDVLDTDQPIVMDDKKYHLTAQTAHIEHVKDNRKLRSVQLTGHVVMVMKPEAPETSVRQGGPVPTPEAAPPAAPTPAAPPAKADDDKRGQDAKDSRKHGGTAYCDKLLYKTYDKFSTLTGSVVFKQSFEQKDDEKNTVKQVERTLTCEHAENDGKANQLHLFKPVHFKSNQDEKMDTPEDVIVGTKEGEETMTMHNSTFRFKSQPEDDGDQSGAAKSGADNQKGVKKPVK